MVRWRSPKSEGGGVRRQGQDGRWSSRFLAHVREAVLRLESTSDSLGGLVKTQKAAPPPLSLGLSRSGVGPKHLLF